jgi:hypothetical protein
MHGVLLTRLGLVLALIALMLMACLCSCSQYGCIPKGAVERHDRSKFKASTEFKQDGRTYVLRPCYVIHIDTVHKQIVVTFNCEGKLYVTYCNCSRLPDTVYVGARVQAPIPKYRLI